MSECRALQKKNEKSKSDLLVSQLDKLYDSRAESSVVPEEYTPFISHGCFVSRCTEQKTCHYIKRHWCFASQSLILDGILPFSSQFATGVTVYCRGWSWVHFMFRFI